MWGPIPAVAVIKPSDGDSGCGTDSEEEMDANDAMDRDDGNYKKSIL